MSFGFAWPMKELTSKIVFHIVLVQHVFVIEDTGLP